MTIRSESGSFRHQTFPKQWAEALAGCIWEACPNQVRTALPSVSEALGISGGS